MFVTCDKSQESGGDGGWKGVVQRFYPGAVFDPKSVITDLETTYTGIVGIRFRKKQINRNKEIDLIYFLPSGFMIDSMGKSWDSLTNFFNKWNTKGECWKGYY